MQISTEGTGPGEGPLTGVRVLDLSTVVSGPLCSQVLGDLGAEVVKVETKSGDTTRRMGIPDASGFTGGYVQFNRNKRSCASPARPTWCSRTTAQASLTVWGSDTRCWPPPTPVSST